MSSAVVETEVPVEETEAYLELTTRAGRRTGDIPADLMVRHVLACVPPHEWPTRVEAMDAVLRRLDAARKDSLRVEARPRMAGTSGSMSPGVPARDRGLIARSCTASTRSRAGAIAPISSRTRSGLCKHILVVLDHLHAQSARLAAGAQGTGVERPAVRHGPVLGPDPAALGAR